MAKELAHLDAGAELTRDEDNALARHYMTGGVANDMLVYDATNAKLIGKTLAETAALLQSSITTLGAITLSGAVAGGDQTFTGVGNMTFTAGSILASGSTAADTLLMRANDTTFITFTTGATDVCELDACTLDTSIVKGTWTTSGTWTIPAHTVSGIITFSGDGVTLLNAADDDRTRIYSATSVSKGPYLQLDGKDYGGVAAGGHWRFSSPNTAWDGRVEWLTVAPGDAPGVVFANCTVDLGASCEADAYTVGGVAGDDESGGGTITTFTITIEKGIVTAFAKVS